MYSEYQNIRIYRNEFTVTLKNGYTINMTLDRCFDITPDVEDKFESIDKKYTINYSSKWLTIFNRDLHKFHKILCTRETAVLIRKFVTTRDEAWELQYCKHLRWKYDKHAILVYFSDPVANEDETTEWIKEHVAPEHSMGTDNQPVAIVYRRYDQSFYVHVVKQSRLVGNVHIPVARGVK
jgi:hypothetical protein